MFQTMFQTMWVLLAYSYNIILVLFIAAHLFVGAIISFLMGLYIGVYLTQNFEIPRKNEPRTLWEKFLDYLERNRRDPHKVSVTNILRPTTMKELVLEDKSALLVPTSPSTEMEAIVKGSTEETSEITLADCQDESQTKIVETDFVEDDAYLDEAYLEEEYEEDEEEEIQITERDKETPNTTENTKPVVELRSNYRTTSVIFTGCEPQHAAEHFRSFSPTNKQVPSTYSANRLSYD